MQDRSVLQLIICSLLYFFMLVSLRGQAVDRLPLDRSTGRLVCGLDIINKVEKGVLRNVICKGPLGSGM